MNRISNLLENKDYRRLQEILNDLYIADIAEIINDLEERDTLIVFRLLNKDIAAEVFANLSMEQQLKIVNSLKLEEMKPIIDELHFDDKIDLLEELPANVVKKVLIFSDYEERKLINEFLNYKEDTAGSIMTIEYVSLNIDSTVKESLDKIRKIGMDKETIYHCYVLTDHKKLIGVVSLRELVIADDDECIKDIMNEDIIYVYTDTDQEEVASIFQKYNLLALPVVDLEDRMTGIVTIDDVLDVMERETTEDFQIMASITPSDDRYLDTSPFKLAKDRILWMTILMIMGIFVGGIIENYEYVLAQYLILNSFVPMIMNSGGNSGIQSTTLAVRNLSIEEVEFSDIKSVAFKELEIGLIIGVIIGFTGFLKVLLIDRIAISFALIVGLSLGLIIICAKVLGGMIPLIADKLGIDPAIMSSSIITTLIDALGLVIYFNIAKLILPL